MATRQPRTNLFNTRNENQRTAYEPLPKEEEGPNRVPESDPLVSELPLGYPVAPSHSKKFEGKVKKHEIYDNTNYIPNDKVRVLGK